REGLHVPFAFLMLIWVSGMPTPELTRPRLHAWRALELLAFLWIPTFVSRAALVNPARRLTDLFSLLLCTGAVLLLTRLTRRDKDMVIRPSMMAVRLRTASKPREAPVPTGASRGP